MNSRPLEDRIAVVAGAASGAGRGIACMLGEAGATVYCTGRGARGRRPPAGLAETAAMVTARGGCGIHVRVNHADEDDVEALFERIEVEQGRLDVLVNDVWGGDELTEWGKPFWELDLERGLTMLEQSVHSHIITSRYGMPLMVEQNRGLIVEITDSAGFYYRGNLFYDLCKVSAIRLAYAMARDLKDYDITAVALAPGFLRTDFVLERLGVREPSWREGIEKDRYFAESETPFFAGRAVVALAADPDVGSKAGRALTTGALAKQYGFEDVDGRRPDLGGYVRRAIAGALLELLESGRIARAKSAGRVKKAVCDSLGRLRLGHALKLKGDELYDEVQALAAGFSEAAVETLVQRHFSFD